MRADHRWLYALLAASLLANLFCAGLWVGRALTPAVPPGAGAIAPGARLRALPADERARFAARMKPRRPSIRAARQAVRAARMRVEGDIAAPAFDRARLQADFAALRQAAAAAQVQQQDALGEALGELSPASRAALVAHPPEAPGVGAGAASR